ncbi:MAG: serine/threonine-protein kinase [Planctomycetota bacterium]|nr:serine/threonine-protein kinase [Planctomycetota bacterium]
MSERLLIESAGRPAAELPRAGTLVVGSDSARAGYVVSGPGVADLHCAIGRAKAGGWAVKDLGSKAGTYVNGARIEVAKLGAGDELRVGDVVLRVLDPAPRPDRTGSSGSGAPLSFPAPPPKSPLPHETQALHVADLAPDLQAAQPVAASPAGPSGPNGSTKSTPLPSISGFRIEKRIGRGGMGDVYLAVQTSLDRRVALKTLTSRFAADAEFVRRFQAEARAAAALNHPNVVTVYDVGEDKGAHYLSMEFMERGTLEDRVAKAGRLPVDEVLAILRDAAAGLVFAEAKRIVHRDLKPANLMQNHVGQTKIADLGLATHVEAEEAQTADRKVFGTPHFMSPEQARGEKVDHRSDLYSLGATAYRLLTGHTPFEGKDAREIVRALLKDEPRPMREFVPDLPEGIVDLVGRLMRKDAAARIQSANELAREIEALRARGGQSPASSDGRKKSSLLPLMLLLLAAGGGAWWWFVGQHQFNPKKPPPPTVARPLTTPDAPPVVTRPKPDPVVPKPAKEKDDKEIQLFEATAKVALLELMQREMQPNDRRDELRLLAQKYQGTTAATDALAKAEEISNALDRASQAATAKKTLVDDLMVKLRAAARLDVKPPEPGKSFLAMRAIPGVDELASDPVFVAARKELENRIVGQATFYARETMGESNRALERGDYEGAKKILADLLPVFDLPEFPIGRAPSGVDELFEVGREAREKYFNLEQVKVAFERKRSREDQLAIAAGLGGASGLERELATLDFAAARERLERLATRLTGPNEQKLARELAAECTVARTVLGTLGTEFAQWRRKSFTDPREKKSTSRNAVGADADGILYEAEAGKVERLPWSAFGADVQALNKLFVERLQREWTTDEQAGIATILRLSASVEAVRAAAKMFDSSKKANFTEGNARDLRGLFAPAAQWAELAGPATKAKLTRESDAAEVLCDALRAATDTRWAAAAAGIERLLTDYADTVLVRLVSDGRTVQEISGG